ncbi:3-oxoacyl-ACP synthase [Sphaerisporangium melleum]|uniref:3-oxoacyl-ACP synthase n=1 Tax=Sphaerisporangium melleum TaxID=321316 RepID=A0A917R3Z2_9ACTN|nr:ketoacyl-ACP synthase III [Sphaerisporangium melleum]GGK87726.1 3-oxoacyl-ACP synthase [Sphaerisporangium melleum]GII72436.1 3-oxoacyl-ACP synthase [Sphaerisporangium melleum]
MRVRTEARTWTGSGLRFSGFGHYYPRTVQDNTGGVTVGGRYHPAEVVADLGVRSLHVAAEDETVEYMSVRAARAALAGGGHAAQDTDLLILANWTDRQWIPEIAPAVAARLGAESALAFDVCGACTGFVHAVQTAASFLTAHPGWRRAVVVAADRFSHRARPGSRGRLVFGDAAGAVVLEKGERDRPGGLLDSVLDCDAAEADTVAARPPEGWLRPRPELIELAVRSSLRVAEALLTRNDMKSGDIDRLVPHPGNNRIHQGVRDGLDLPAEKFLTNFAQRGNTGCASIPIALSEFSAAGALRPGELVLSTAVGSGWYYGGLLYRL